MMPNLNIVRSGPLDGAPVVLLHGLGLDLGMWDEQFEGLTDAFHIIAVDLPGHGLSPETDGVPTFDEMAGKVAAAIEVLAVGPVHLVGLSVGGMIAQALTVTYPAMVRSLTLVATSCTFPEAVRQMLRARALTAEADGMVVMAESHIARWFPEAFRRKRPEVLDRIRKTLIRQDRTFHARLWDMVAALDMEMQIAAVAVPTLVIVGAEDPSAPLAAGELIARQIGDDAEVAVLPDCGHFPPIEFPESFNALLRNFLARQ